MNRELASFLSKIISLYYRCSEKEFPVLNLPGFKNLAGFREVIFLKNYIRYSLFTIRYW
jgi:hypothetical protein